MKDLKELGVSLFYIAVILALPASWVTHLVVCFSDEKWGFLIAGAIFFPVAMVHGIGVWLGAW